MAIVGEETKEEESQQVMGGENSNDNGDNDAEVNDDYKYNSNSSNLVIRPGISADSTQTMYYDVDQSRSNDSGVNVGAGGGTNNGKEVGQGGSLKTPSSRKQQVDPPGGRLGSVYFDAQTGVDDGDDDEEKKIGRGGRDIDFLKDKHGHMTYGRRLALYLASNYAWYNPKLKEKGETKKQNSDKVVANDDDTPAARDDDNNRPSIEKAWAYFEHVTLERYEIPDDYTSKSERLRLGGGEDEGGGIGSILSSIFKGGDQKLNIAEPGETSHPTKLYSPLTTPLEQMGDFGLGYGVYFSTLRSFALLSLVAAILNLPNLLYFSSTGYSNGQAELPALLKGSAICTEHEWVICDDCPRNYVYPKGSFSKWKEQFILEARYVGNASEFGEWVNVSKYLNFSLIYPNDPNVPQPDYGDTSSGGLVGVDELPFGDDNETIVVGRGPIAGDDIIQFFQGTRNETSPLRNGYQFDQFDKLFTDQALKAIRDDLGIQFHSNVIEIEVPSVFAMDGSLNKNISCNSNNGAGRGVSSCIEEYCRCQSEDSLYDCYCQLGSELPFTDTAVKIYGFAEKNMCGDGATTRNGFINLATVILFSIGAIIIRRKQDALIVKFDEDEQTAQDYSICVMNPPPDAYDPQEWKAYFESIVVTKEADDNASDGGGNGNGIHVTVCTVDVDNDHIVQQLAKRRELLKQLDLLVPGDIEIMKDKEKMKELIEVEKGEVSGSFMHKIGLGSKDGLGPIGKLHQQLIAVEDEIRGELKNTSTTSGEQRKELPASTVFCTFETETGQRKVLGELATLGRIDIRKQDKSSVKHPSHLFRGKHVLDIIEPEEPSSIRWEDMNATSRQIATQLAITSGLCLLLIVIASVIILWLYPILPGLAPLVTTVFTSIFPMFAKALMEMEHHRSETSRQKWLFIKIAVFNILVTTVLLSVVNPFVATLDPKIGSLSGLIPAIHGLFFSQLTISPVLQLVDYMGHLNRHILAPRAAIKAKTQQQLNRLFHGAPMYLAERYANLMKYLFLIVWYCALYPQGLFMGSFALFVVYYVDRFSLMRTWSRAPQVGTEIADFARNYFTPTALVLMAVLSAYAWSGFPYDNLCLDEETEAHPGYFNADWHNLTSGSDGTSGVSRTFNLQAIGTQNNFLFISFQAPDIDLNVTLDASTSQVYKYCLQDFRAYLNQRSFPPLPKFQIDEWMTVEQENLLQVYGWMSVVLLVFVVLTFVVRNVYHIVVEDMGINILGLCADDEYAARGKDMKIPFSSLKSIDAYYPSYQPSNFGYPYLLSDVTNIDPSLFSWTDPDAPHSEYDVTKDLPNIISRGSNGGDPSSSNVNTRHVFAKVMHWPPSS